MAPIWSSCPWVMTMPRMRSSLPLQIGDIGDDQVHAELLGFGEGHAHIHDEDVVAIFDDGHVLADFPQTSEGDDANFTLCV